MQIAMIGTGRMAQNLASGWGAAGHTIVFGSRTPEQKSWLVEKIRHATITDHTSAIANARTVVLSIPYEAIAAFVAEHAAQLQNRLVLDISNPFEHLPDNRIAAAEITAQLIGPGARVVAAFKTNFWGTLLDPHDSIRGMPHDVYFAGDNADDKQIVALLIEDLGFRPVDCGPLHNARLLDAMFTLLVELDRRYSNGQHKAAWGLQS